MTKTMKVICLSILFIAWVFITMLGPANALDAPKLLGRVNDYGDVLTPSQENVLEKKLESIESLKKGTQIVVLTIPSLEGDSIEDFANKTFREWKLGQYEHDNGLLIVNAIKDRKIRIEVGRGLEGDIPDAISSLIISQAMVPNLKAGNYFQAFDDAATHIGDIIHVENLPTKITPRTYDGGSYFWPVILLLIFGVGTLTLAFVVLRPSRKDRILAEYEHNKRVQEQRDAAIERAKRDSALRNEIIRQTKKKTPNLAAEAAAIAATIPAENKIREAAERRKRDEEYEEQRRASERHRREEEDRRRNEESSYTSSSSSWSSSSYDSGSSFSGGGGDSGGGGSSSSY